MDRVAQQAVAQGDVDLDALLPDEGHKHGIGAVLHGAWRRIAASPSLLAGGALLGGLLIGWLLLGWLLFPVEWSNTDPWDLRPEHQMRYLELLAADYWQTGDIRLVQEAVEGWEPGELTDVLSKLMGRNDLTAERRQQIAALVDALQLPVYESSLLASLLANQKALLLAVILAALPILLAVGLLVAPLVHSEGHAKTEDELLAEEAEAALAEGGSLEDLVAAAENDDDEEEEAAQEEEKVLSEEETQELATEITSMLSGLFDDEGQDQQLLQALAKGLGDVPIEDLRKRATAVRDLLALALAQRDRA